MSASCHAIWTTPPTSHVQEKKGDNKCMEFEQAVSLTGHGKFHHFLLLGCGLCLVSMIFETLSTSYLLPAAQCDFNMSSGEKGLLNAVIYVGMICSSHLWGYLADTKGRRKVLIATLLLDGVCTLIASFMPTFWLFLFFRFLNGIFICGPSAVVYAYLGEFHAEKTRTRAMVWVCAFIALGIGVQPGLAWLVIPQGWSMELPWYTFHSWRVFVILCGIPALVTSVLLWLFMPESPKFLLAVGRDKEALDVLRTVYASNSGDKPENYPVSALRLDIEGAQKAESNSPLAVLQHMWRQTAPIFHHPYLLSTMLSCFIQFGLYSSSNGFLLWIPDLFNRMAEFEKLYPNDTASICEVVSTLHYLGVPESIEYSTGTAERNTTLLSLVLLGSNSTGVLTEELPCNSDVDSTAFQNTLVIGLTSSVAYTLVGYLIAFMGKKMILVVFLMTSGACGVAMYFARTYLELLLLPGFFVVLSGMCVSVINSIVIDVFPTHLRAMALCLSLMMGRVGTVTSNMLLGILLEINCAAVIFMLSGILLVCGLLSLLLPTPKKSH